LSDQLVFFVRFTNQRYGPVDLLVHCFLVFASEEITVVFLFGSLPQLYCPQMQLGSLPQPQSSETTELGLNRHMPDPSTVLEAAGFHWGKQGHPSIRWHISLPRLFALQV